MPRLTSPRFEKPDEICHQVLGACYDIARTAKGVSVGVYADYCCTEKEAQPSGASSPVQSGWQRTLCQASQGRAKCTCSALNVTGRACYWRIGKNLTVASHSGLIGTLDRRSPGESQPHPDGDDEIDIQNCPVSVG